VLREEKREEKEKDEVVFVRYYCYLVGEDEGHKEHTQE
jgi:hypothetical protein